MNTQQTQAQQFQSNLSADETAVEQTIAAILDQGGKLWGEDAYKVEFKDNSYYSMAIFHPEGDLPYYNGSAKTNLKERIKSATSWEDLTFQEINTARGTFGEVGQFRHLVNDGECHSCGREFSEYGGCRWSDCPENV